MSSRLQGDLLQRSFDFALAVIAVVEELPDGTIGWVLGKQLLRSGTSIGANLREADNALTDAEFAQRCSVARKEASETCYWIRLGESANVLSEARLAPTLTEADELTRILSTIVKKTQQRLSPRT